MHTHICIYNSHAYTHMYIPYSYIHTYVYNILMHTHIHIHILTSSACRSRIHSIALASTAAACCLTLDDTSRVRAYTISRSAAGR